VIRRADYDITSGDGQGYRIAKVIDWLKLNYTLALRVDELASRVQMSTTTFHHHFRQAKYANGALVKLSYPTDDVRLMTKAAVDAVDRVFRPRFKYSKAEVLLVNLCQKGEYTISFRFLSRKRQRK